MREIPMHVPSLPSPDKLHEECAVVGVYGHKEAANLTYLGLYALHHGGCWSPKAEWFTQF